jgi:hypothetical protein
MSKQRKSCYYKEEEDRQRDIFQYSNLSFVCLFFLIFLSLIFFFFIDSFEGKKAFLYFS